MGHDLRLLLFVTEQRHLKRLTLVWEKQPVYFITTCVADRKPLLASTTVHAILQEELSGLRERYGWAVGRYVIMPDHVHFFVTPLLSEAKSLNLAIGKWKEWTAKRILRSTGELAPLWQPEFFDHLLRSDESRADKWSYMQMNPVRAGLVTRAENWAYAGAVDFE